MSGPLSGIKVLEFTEIVAGPFSGALLTDMGADTIKVEPPWGEPSRGTQPIMPFESRGYVSLNRGKRSLPLDLNKPQAREIVYQLVPQMDVVIINYRPDVPANLGIDYETLSAINPRLIYCQNTAFGTKGPHAKRPGSDIVTQAMTGLMVGNRNIRDGVPQLINPALADYATGITMAWGISAALYHREKTGRGQKIEASLLATALAIQSGRFMQIASVDAELREKFLSDLEQYRAESRSFEEVDQLYLQFRPRQAGNIYYRTYETRNGLITVGCLSNPPRKRMAELLGLRDIRFEEGYDARTPESRAFGEQLALKAAELMKEKTTEEWLEIFDRAGVPVSPVYYTEELVEHEQVAANENVVALEHSMLGPLTMYGPTLKMNETPLRAQRAAPALGEHTDDILSGLGYTAEQIEALRRDEVTR